MIELLFNRGLFPRSLLGARQTMIGPMLGLTFLGTVANGLARAVSELFFRNGLFPLSPIAKSFGVFSFETKFAKFVQTVASGQPVGKLSFVDHGHYLAFERFGVSRLFLGTLSRVDAF